MNWMPPETPPFGDRIDFLWKRGVRFLSDAAIAFAMSAATAIGVGIAVSDNAFIQILVIPLVALAFWVPFFFIVLRVHMWLAHRRTDHRREPGSAPPARRSWRQKLRSIFEMMTGRGLDRDVLAAYCFLCRHYREGDRIYLFGFSRGAYTVRVVAGLIYLIGLLREHQINFAGFALKAYKSASETDNFLVAQQFRRVVTPQTVPIHFLGVWDTVLSIIVPGRLPFSKLRLEELPYTSKNPAVRAFRHAIAIDEFRRMFRIKRWAEPQTFKPNFFSQAKSFPAQDISQVWFAGCHSDVGGGFVEEQSALSKYPLLWMLEQAKQQGLRIRTDMVNHIVRGRPRANARTYTKPDAAGLLHRSLNSLWWVLKALPKAVKYRDWPGRRTLLGFYIPWGEPRLMPDGSFVHASANERVKSVPAYKPVNIAVRIGVEK